MREEYEQSFLQYKKESLDAVKVFVDETMAQLKEVNASVVDMRSSVGADLRAAKDSIGTVLDNVKTSLSTEIAGLAASVNRMLRPDAIDLAGASASTLPRVDAFTAGPDRRRWDQHHRRAACALHIASPVGGNYPDRPQKSLAPTDLVPVPHTDISSPGPRVDLSQFDGANPKLW
jgi:hypothetical protein